MLEPFLKYFRAQAAVSEDLFELCYLSAYDAFPTAVEKNADEFWSTYSQASQPALAWFTEMCLLTQSEVDYFLAANFSWHKGQLLGGRKYMILEYPEPDSVDLEIEAFVDRDKALKVGSRLFPYFSVFLEGTKDRAASCFALGQSPVAGITTLRRCTTAAHYNLGSGPEPKLVELVAWLTDLEDREILGYTVRHQAYLSDLDRVLMSEVCD